MKPPAPWPPQLPILFAGRKKESAENTAAPAFINLVLHQLDQQFTRDRIEHGGLTIITTLDYDLQQQASCTTLVYTARLAGTPDPIDAVHHRRSTALRCLRIQFRRAKVPPAALDL